jgi:hypothetical protein
MRALCKKFIFVAAAAVTVLAFIQSPSAQNSGTAGKGKDVPAVSAAADQKAADAMSTPPTSGSTEADRKADTAMGASNPAK